MNSKTLYIDINADLGEGRGNDAKIMPLISSCNIACGGHSGDAESMRQAIRLAMENGVKVGAHPSFPDTDNFGRKVLTITKEELKESLYKQLMLFVDICDSEKATLHHIKPHGALYNYAAGDAPTADAIIEAILATGRRPILYVPYGSVLHKKAENLLPLVFEAFIDRYYNDNLSLVNREEENAIIHNAEEAWEQLRSMVVTGSLKTVSGTYQKMEAQTFCIHSDHSNSLEILEYIRSQMKHHNIKLSS